MASLSNVRISYDEDRLKLAELSVMCTVPMVLMATIRLGIPQILGSADPTMLSASDILSRISACKSPEVGILYLEKMLRVLASRDIIKENMGKDSIRIYGLTRLYRLLVNEKSSLSHLIVVQQSPLVTRPLEHLHEAVLQGIGPFMKAYHGSTLYKQISSDPEVDSLFNKSMSGHSTVMTSAIVEVYSGFEPVRTLVDVGGGIGTSLEVILATHPHIRGINYDQPHVIAKAPTLKGVQHVAGDMFESIPTGDTILLKWILHNWDDEACIRLLRTCYNSLANFGKVVVIESTQSTLPEVVHRGAASRVISSYDLLMFSLNNGKERSLSEFKSIAFAAGFVQVELVATVDYLSVIEFHKEARKD